MRKIFDAIALTTALAFFLFLSFLLTLKSLLIYNFQRRIRRKFPPSLGGIFSSRRRSLCFLDYLASRSRSKFDYGRLRATKSPLRLILREFPFSDSNIPPRSVAPAVRKTEWIARESHSRRFLRPRRRIFLRNSGSVTIQSVAAPPILRSRPRSWVREPDRRLAATSAAWRTSKLGICLWRALTSRAAGGRTSPGTVRDIMLSVFLIASCSASPRRCRVGIGAKNSARTPNDSYRARYMSKIVFARV